MNKIDIYEKAYYYEIDRLDRINSRISIPLGVVTLIVGSLMNIIVKYFKLPNLEWVGYFKSIFYISISMFIYSIYLIIRSYHGYKIAHVPLFKDIDKYENNLKLKSEGKEESYVQNKLEEYYINILKEARDNNFILNEKKLKYQLKLGICISIQIPLIGILYVLLIYFNV